MSTDLDTFVQYGLRGLDTALADGAENLNLSTITTRLPYDLTDNFLRKYRNDLKRALINECNDTNYMAYARTSLTVSRFTFRLFDSIDRMTAFCYRPGLAYHNKSANGMVPIAYKIVAGPNYLVTVGNAQAQYGLPKSIVPGDSLQIEENFRRNVQPALLAKGFQELTLKDINYRS